MVSGASLFPDLSQDHAACLAVGGPELCEFQISTTFGGIWAHVVILALLKELVIVLGAVGNFFHADPSVAVQFDKPFEGAGLKVAALRRRIFFRLPDPSTYQEAQGK